MNQCARADDDEAEKGLGALLLYLLNWHNHSVLCLSQVSGGIVLLVVLLRPTTARGCISRPVATSTKCRVLLLPRRSPNQHIHTYTHTHTHTHMAHTHTHTHTHSKYLVNEIYLSISLSLSLSVALSLSLTRLDHFTHTHTNMNMNANTNTSHTHNIDVVLIVSIYNIR
jgi:hypothetical protein